MNKYICMIAYTNYFGDARVRREAEALAAIPDYRILVLVPRLNRFPNTYVIDSVKVRELNVPKYRGGKSIGYLMSYLSFLFLASLACTRMLMNQSLDVVHVHNMPNFLVFCGMIPLLCGKKIILDIHDTFIETFSIKFPKRVNKISLSILFWEERICCALAHKIICVNHVQREALIKRGIPENKVMILMNVPDPKRFNVDQKMKARTKAKGGFRLVYYGTMSKMLGVDLAIRAVAKVNALIPKLEFHIIGGGGDTEEFLQLSGKLGMKKVVHFYNRFFRLEHLIEMLDGMELSIVPNRRNAATELMLPVKMMESIALGIPVVAPRLRSIEYYFTDGMVFYFDPDSVESLALTIYEAFKNEDARLKKVESAKTFLETFGWQKHKFDLINVYKRLV